MPGHQFRALRPHSKSKGGCKRCKARKVKCNEGRPCDSCVRRNESCEYFEERTRSRKAPSHGPANGNKSSTASANLTTSPSPPYEAIEDKFIVADESSDRRLLELKLMHHFVTVTVQKDFLSTHDGDVLDMWYRLAPELAVQYPVLLNIILAIAALHITKVYPEQTDMANIHRVYFNAAVSQHRHFIRDINADNAEAVCLSTVLIALPAFTFLQNTEVSTYSPPLQLFYLVAGNAAIFTMALPLLSEKSKIRSVIHAKPDVMEFLDEVRENQYKQQFSTLLEWRAPGEVIDSESQESYDTMLGSIGGILINIEKGLEPLQLRRLLYGLPSVVPSTFVQRLQERNPRALTILAYYFSLAKAMDNVWWMRGISEREVLGIQRVLPEEWQWAMAWPLQRLALYAVPSAPPTQGASA